jgi:hypothetical protein
VVLVATIVPVVQTMVLTTKLGLAHWHSASMSYY